MATKVNEILQFASQDTGSNLLTQSEYDGDAQRVIGHQPGIARSRLENKVLRQCSTMAAGLAEFVLQNQDGSVTDSMSPQEIAAALTSAIGGIGGTNINRIANVTATWGGLQNTTLDNSQINLVEIVGNGISIITGTVYCNLKAVINISSGALINGRLSLVIDGKPALTSQMAYGVGVGFNSTSVRWENVNVEGGYAALNETIGIAASFKAQTQILEDTSMKFQAIVFALQ